MPTMASGSAIVDQDNHLRARLHGPSNPQLQRTQSHTSGLDASESAGLFPGKSSLQLLHIFTKTTSGTSTPLTPSALPSLHSISTARKALRAEQRRRLFPTIEYSSRVSHFDPNSDYRDFQGFFVLFWIALTILAVTTILRNLKETGYPMRIQIWQLFTIKTWELGVADGFMVLCTLPVLPLQKLCRGEYIRWRGGGMALQSLYQVVWFSLWVAVPFLLGWTWTAQVFLVLHTFVMLMKMHSYAFYNGHLSESERRLKALDAPSTASTSPAYQYPKPDEYFNIKETVAKREADEKLLMNKQDSIDRLREDLAIELTSPMGNTTFPANLSISNFVDYLFCPTLCYELEYPRTPGIVWSELAYKVTAVFGCIFLLTIVSEEFILPVLSESAARLESTTSWFDLFLILGESISMLLFPFMVTFLLVFLVIFEYVLGAFAEITCFADRHFYNDWWNSTDWLEFSREWNIPVHHFFRRHVYSASRPHIGRPMATLITFLISAVGHEIVMACITKKIRGYGFMAQMSQLPIILIQRTKFMRGKRVLNNVAFWMSMILGLSMICSLYVLC